MIADVTHFTFKVENLIYRGHLLLYSRRIELALPLPSSLVLDSHRPQSCIESGHEKIVEEERREEGRVRKVRDRTLFNFAHEM